MKGIEIVYDIIKNDFYIESNLKYSAIKEIMDSYISKQFRKRGDFSEPNQKRFYNLQLEYDSNNFDGLFLASDTNNRDVDLGILLDVFQEFKA